jgi:hypothetical protein
MAVFPSLVIASSSVSANPIAEPTPFDLTIKLVLPNLPINGFMLLVMYYLFIRVESMPVQQGMVKHYVAFMLSVSMLTFSGALIDTVAFVSEDQMVYLAAAALIGCTAVLVSYRYLKVTPRFSLYTGAFFFIVNMIAWQYPNRWFWERVSNPGTSMVFLGVLIIAVMIEAYIVHNVPPQPPRERSYRKWFLENWIFLEAFLLCLILLYVAVEISVNPIFNLPE